MGSSYGRIGLAALALLTAGLLLSVGILSLRVQAARSAAPAITTRVYVDPAISSVGVGETLPLSIAIEGAEDLNTYQFDLHWDPAVFTFTSAADAGFLEEPVSSKPFLPEPGTLIFGAFHAAAYPTGADGDGVLATVTLRAIGPGTSTLDVDRVTLIDIAQVITTPEVIDDGWAEALCDPVRLTAVEANTPVELGEVMHFTATATGSPAIDYAWDFGGAGTASGGDTATPSYIYDALGEYTVTVTATNPCDVDQGAITVAVTCDTAEISSLASDSPVQPGETMHFTASVAGAEPITYTWDFDSDGAPERVGAGLDAVTYTYPALGIYTTTLTVDNACAVEHRETLQVWVVDESDLVRITDLTADEPGVVGRPLEFTATVTGAQPITYTWDADSDGVAEEVGLGLDTFTHVYTSGGTYTATLSVENAFSTDAKTAVVDVEHVIFLPLVLRQGG